MRKLLLGESRGSAESFLTITPQIFVFLIMFQLIFMQFNIMRDSHLSQGELANTAISGDGAKYSRYPLVGGGSLLLREDLKGIPKFIDFTNPQTKRVVAIAVDEDERN